nr:PREDICTED: pickpocket protein 19-like [Bemisia tabaci]
MWDRFSSSPTVTAVKDTHLPLYSLPFPAVSICATDKIRRDEAYHYLSSYVNLSNPATAIMVDDFLATMSLFQYPAYSRMKYYLNRTNDFLPQLSKVNLTDFMLYVSPTCEELFAGCFWIGHQHNCCELFDVQRSEEGFCYSFNSLTSQRRVDCPPLGDLSSVSYILDVEEELRRTHPSCNIRRNTAAGATTGLEVFLHKFNQSDRIRNATNIIGESGFRVQIYHPSEYPEAGMGNLIAPNRAYKMSASVKSFMTISTDQIRKLDVDIRFCFFPDEQQLSVSKTYTQRSCLIECRLDYLHKMCNCRPYYFNMLDNRIPICGPEQLKCIAAHNKALRLFSPPFGNIRGFSQNISSGLSMPLNCSQCLPTCHESTYDVDTDFSRDTQPLAQKTDGYVDVFYKNEGAVKYQRDVTFGWSDLLVSFGGIAGLFLGFSVLSLVELFYWVGKIISFYASESKAKTKRQSAEEKLQRTKLPRKVHPAHSIHFPHVKKLY